MFRQTYLSNPHWWFSATDEDDAYITREFGHLLDQESTTDEDPLNMILIYDQLPRHIFRNTPSSHIISWYLQRALDICLRMTPEYLDTLTAQEWCFAFMPYRHTNDPHYIAEIAKLAWAKITTLTTPDDISIMQRFLKALYERCPTEDQAEFIAEYSSLPNSKRESLQCIYEDHRNILDTQTHTHPPPPIQIQLPLSTDKHTILSLSGGVDSMVCSYILAKQNTEFQAVHINYGNRDTADAEEAFVKDWCAYLGVSLYVRRITEIKREPCMKHNMREIYETYTRRVRLGTYDTVSACTIVLGHNKDDCLENIMTNIAGRTHYENLTGMSHEKFYRPLLNVSKADIKAFAAHHRIPHLPNSTPPWSQRGQIRASVVPVLDAWNPLFIPGMHHLSTTLSQYHQLARHLARLFVSQPSINLVVNNACFWRVVFTILTPTQHPSLRSIDNLIATVNAKTPPYTVVITKHLTMKVDKAGCVAFSAVE